MDRVVRESRRGMLGWISIQDAGHTSVVGAVNVVDLVVADEYNLIRRAIMLFTSELKNPLIRFARVRGFRT